MLNLVFGLFTKFQELMFEETFATGYSRDQTILFALLLSHLIELAYFLLNLPFFENFVADCLEWKVAEASYELHEVYHKLPLVQVRFIGVPPVEIPGAKGHLEAIIFWV